MGVVADRSSRAIHPVASSLRGTPERAHESGASQQQPVAARHHPHPQSEEHLALLVEGNLDAGLLAVADDRLGQGWRTWISEEAA